MTPQQIRNEVEKEEKRLNDFIGKKILSIILLDVSEDYMKTWINKICKNDYSEIDNAHLILFEDESAIVFVDFDSDGYRSGNWNIVKLKKVLDRGNTKEIKTINSVCRNIEFFKDKPKIASSYSSEASGVLITTDEYIIKMGQDNSDSYYPSNFFNVEECKTFALGEGELIK
jgi:hypothetical protein